MSETLDRPLFSAPIPNISNCMWYFTGGPKPETVPLAAEESCDVLVIGGGFNGVTAGLVATEAGARVILVDGHEIGAGATGRNAGMVNPGQLIGPEEIREALGADYGDRFLEHVGGAPKLVRDYITRFGIECYVDDRPIIRAAHNGRARKDLEAQAKFWQGLGARVEMIYDGEVEALVGSKTFSAALMDYRGFTIQPLAYIRGLARAAAGLGLTISTGTPVTALSPENGAWVAQVGSSRIRAGKVILATNAFSGNLYPGLKQVIVPTAAFGLGTEPLPAELRAQVFPTGLSFYDTHEPPLFFRYDPEGRLMVGCLGFLPPQGWSMTSWADRAFRQVFPDLTPPKWTTRWQGRIGLTPDHMPRLVTPQPGLYATIGCNGRGIAPNTYFGGMLARMALGDTTPGALPVSPLRAYPMRKLKMQAYDTGFRIYRNTLLFL